MTEMTRGKGKRRKSLLEIDKELVKHYMKSPYSHPKRDEGEKAYEDHVLQGVNLCVKSKHKYGDSNAGRRKGACRGHKTYLG